MEVHIPRSCLEALRRATIEISKSGKLIFKAGQCGIRDSAANWSSASLSIFVYVKAVSLKALDFLLPAQSPDEPLDAKHSTVTQSHKVLLQITVSVSDKCN